MHQERMIAIDHGNRNMKTENFIFTSGLQISEKQPPFGDYMIYQNHYYTLTEQRIPYQKDKTLDERFFELTLFSIVKELAREEGDSSGQILRISLPVGLPPKHYGSLWQKFEKYLCREGIQSVTYRGRNYMFCISDVMAFPQDYAAAMTVYNKLKDYMKVIVIDLGGFTLDYLLMRSGQPDLGVCDSLDNGVIKLYNGIASRISSEYDILLEELDMDQIIQDKPTDYSREVICTVQAIAKVFTDDFLGSLRERNIDLKSGCVVFAGGGSLLLKNYIQASGKAGNCIFITDLQANAKGYGILYHLQKGR